MIFLSRHHGDNSNPHEIIPISFNMGKILQQNYQNYAKTFLVQTRSQSKTKSTKPSDTHSGVKSIGKSKRKEIKPIIIDDEPTIIDLDTKTGIDTQVQDAAVTKIPDNSIRQGNRGILYPDPIARSLPKPPELIDKRTEPKKSVGSTPNIDFEENSPHQEGIISEMYINLDQSYF